MPKNACGSWTSWKVPDLPTTSPSPFQYAGPLDVGAFQKSVQTLVQRHDILRITIPLVRNQPVQRVHPISEVVIPIIDLSGLADQTRVEVLNQLLETEALRPFILDSDRLFRIHFMRLNAEEQVLSITQHHIISDGWSLGIMMSELATLYCGYCAEKPADLSPLKIQYGDFAQWQRKWAQGAFFKDQLIYWNRQLEGAPPLLELPIDRPRPKLHSFSGDRVNLEIEPELNRGLKELGRQLRRHFIHDPLGCF